ncbi:hypothetical protein L228DRAFT_217558 [Xylona heveae TC161]|uniref:Rab-GAP TBC domain-containing protein n=1 Tax=Xylona heveae (strain CBS 132557 / TC161) TaxID=1328760 RepID=A0A165IPC8_XYLHT|nr:hypothetical protein L228DRAFT_217558 [Xylona heveae TC161]KZF25186.1 hypothetical protein L228DRAFT_217558 [Xylona heveae TC161]
MATPTTSEGDQAQISASLGGQDPKEPPQRPLYQSKHVPSDSMVTVRLSDSTISSRIEAFPRLSRPVPNIITEDEVTGIPNRAANRWSMETTTPSTVGDTQTASAYQAAAAAALEGHTAESSDICSKSRTNSVSSASSEESDRVDWAELDKTEEQEPRDECSDESTAFLLARLERENNALATDPKSNLRTGRVRSKSRPPSIHQIKQLVREPVAPLLRYSQLPAPPPMTELEFWAALVQDYPRTAQRLPTLTSNKVRAGIPPPLRGVVWQSMAGARDKLLEEQYDRLAGEQSPYENLIGKDIGRSFPGVEMFRDPEGEGQKMMGRVLKCFSLYDHKIGYCQGLGFLVGPLLMQMGEKEAFCMLVRLMEHYDLRSCFLPDLSGLHVRIYQFQNLLNQHLPNLAAHLDNLQIEPAYIPQWFLSFFAATCPLPMLLRIYDVLLAEGAAETLILVALSLMRRNETRIMAYTEFEDVMQFLLSRAMWDTYSFNTDDFVNDFVGFTGVVSRENLQSLESSFLDAQSEGSATRIGSLPDLQAAASRFLGRLWAGSNSSTKSASLTPGLAAPSRPISFLRRSPSKQSIASTLNSCEGGSDSVTSSAQTDATSVSRQSSTDYSSTRAKEAPSMAISTRSAVSIKDRDLHGQIEDLLTAMSASQREHGMVLVQLQKEKEDREEKRRTILSFIDLVRRFLGQSGHLAPSAAEPTAAIPENVSVFIELSKTVEFMEQTFASEDDNRRSSILQTKHQLRDESARYKQMLDHEMIHSQELSRRIDEQEQEMKGLREELRLARARLQDGYNENQRLQQTIQNLRSRSPACRSPDDASSPVEGPATQSGDGLSRRGSVHGGLRELKLGRTASKRSQTTPIFAKRTSSLSTQGVLSTENHKPVAEDTLLVELVNAKTSEALAKQELEEVKGKLESMRKLVNQNHNNSGSGSQNSPRHEGHDEWPRVSTTTTTPPVKTPDQQKTTPPASSSGGFWSGWGKRSVSSTVPQDGR